MAIEIRQVAVSNSGDDEGMLLLRDGKLIALVVQLSAEHETGVGQWFVEWFTAGAMGLPQYTSASAACAALDEKWQAHHKALLGKSAI